MRSISSNRRLSSLTEAAQIRDCPDKLFLLPVHTQLPIAKLTAPKTRLLEENSKKVAFMKRVEDGATFRAVLRKFSEHIRIVHKRRITWPKEDLFKQSE